MAFPFSKPTAGVNGFFTDLNFEDPAKLLGEVATFLGPGVQTITYAATINPDFSISRVALCTLTGALTVGTPVNAAPLVGTEFTLILLQDGTGGRTIAYSGTMKGTGGVAAVTTLSTYTIDTFVWDGTNYRLKSRITGQVA